MKKSKSIFIALLLITTACAQTETKEISEMNNMKTQDVVLSGNEEIATVAGGCFWCIEAPFEKIEGIKKGAILR